MDRRTRLLLLGVAIASLAAPAPAVTRVGVCYVFDSAEKQLFDALVGPFSRPTGSFEDFEGTNGAPGSFCTVDGEDVDCEQGNDTPTGPCALPAHPHDAGDILLGLRINVTPPRPGGPSLRLVGFTPALPTEWIRAENPGDGIEARFSFTGSCSVSTQPNAVGFDQLAVPGGPLDYDVELSGGGTMTVSDAAPPGGPGFLGLYCDVPVVKVTSHSTPGVAPGIDNVRFRVAPLDTQVAIKSVTPAWVQPTGDVTYDIEVAYFGLAPAANVTVTDDFPACLDASGFDPATDVSVAGGGFTASYTAPTLTVDLGTLNRGDVRTVTVVGLKGGPVQIDCCNQARVTSSLVPPPGFPTVDATGAAGPTCLQGCHLVRSTVRLPAGPAGLYGRTCAPDDVRLTNARIPDDVVTGDDLGYVSWFPPNIEYIQFDCSCSSTMFLVKDWPVGSSRFHIEY